MQQVQDCLSSGLSAKEWCKENDVSVKTFYYWKRRTDISNKKDTQWIDLSKSTESGSAYAACEYDPIIVRVGNFTIELGGAFDEKRLEGVLAMVAALC